MRGILASFPTVRHHDCVVDVSFLSEALAGIPKVYQRQALALTAEGFSYWNQLYCRFLANFSEPLPENSVFQFSGSEVNEIIPLEFFQISVFQSYRSVRICGEQCLNLIFA